MKIKISNKIVNIRNSSWNDYRYCYELTKRNMRPFYIKHKLEWKPKSYRRNFNPKFVKIIELNNRRIGFYKLSFKENNWHLGDLQISGLFRGRGIGTKIMELLERIIKRKGLKMIKLRVFVDNPALAMYKRIGYKIIEEQGSSYLMQKKLH
ncbi:MAG: GNAT family N-acetyltransferase [Patescibacteria group bacterium]|nr:GNAT family N-acetyltransferase [Patescibacteria group bacterium]